MKTRLFLILVAIATLLGQTGCATLIALQLKNKLPKVEAESLVVSVNIVGIGGGSAETKGQHYDADGNLVFAEFHETISTGTGGVKIDGTGVKIPAQK